MAKIVSLAPYTKKTKKAYMEYLVVDDEGKVSLGIYDDDEMELRLFKAKVTEDIE